LLGVVPWRAHGGEGGGAGEGAVGGVEGGVDGAPGGVPGRGDERVVGGVEEPVAALDGGAEAAHVGGAVDPLDERPRSLVRAGLGDGTAARAQAGEDGGEASRLLGEAERD